MRPTQAEGSSLSAPWLGQRCLGGWCTVWVSPGTPTPTALVKVSARCRKEDMLFINYEAPDGTKRHNHLYNGGNAEARIRLYEKKNGRLYLVDDIDATHVGCEYGEMDR